MNKAVVATLLSVSAFVASPAILLAQATQPGGGQVQLDPKEFAAYDNAVNKQTTPQTQQPAMEQFLKDYPNSAVKGDVMQRLMIVDYTIFSSGGSTSSADGQKAITAADNVLQTDPNNLTADFVEVAVRRAFAEQQTDPAARQTGMDAAASYAQKGVSATPTKPDDPNFTKQQTALNPTFYSAIGTAALSKKDTATAIDAFKKELAAVPVASTQTVGTPLQDTYYLGQAYYQSTPPDYVNCTFYATRAYSYSPAQFQAQMPLAQYCYKKYHGGTDGYDAVVTAAKANVNPPSGFTIVAAPSDADIAAKTVADTPDLATLALSDKEFILKNGQPDVAEKVFATIKGKTVEIPNATVIAATADSLQVAVSDDAVQGKVADFTFNMKTPLTKVPDVGTKVNLDGTYSSYTQSPVMIIMSDASVAATAVPKRPAPSTRRRPS